MDWSSAVCRRVLIQLVGEVTLTVNGRAVNLGNTVANHLILAMLLLRYGSAGGERWDMREALWSGTVEDLHVRQNRLAHRIQFMHEALGEENWRLTPLRSMAPLRFTIDEDVWVDVLELHRVAETGTIEECRSALLYWESRGEFLRSVDNSRLPQSTGEWLVTERIRLAAAVKRIKARLAERDNRCIGELPVRPVTRNELTRDELRPVYRSLTPSLHRASRALCVFPQSGDLVACAAVLGTTPLDANQQISELEKAGMVRRAVSGATVRYVISDAVRGLLRTIQEADDDGAEDAGEVQARHAAYYGELGCQLPTELNGLGQTAALTLLREEQQNIQEALNWLEVHDPDRAVDLASRLWRYWDLVGERAFGHRRMVQLLERDSVDRTSESFAAALQGRGTLAFRLGLPEAYADFEEALHHWEQLRNQGEIARLLRQLGRCEGDQGRYATAHQRYQQALQICLAQQDLEGAAHGYNGRGYLFAEQGDFMSANPCWEAALALWQRTGNTQQIAADLNCLGLAAYLLHGSRPAEHLWHESLERYRQLDDRSGLAFVLVNLAGCAIDDGRFAEARDWLQESLRSREELGEQKQRAMSLTGLALLELVSGRAEEANKVVIEALQLWLNLGDATGSSAAAEVFAAILAARGELAMTVQLVSAAAAVRKVAHARISPFPKLHRDRVARACEAARKSLGRQGFVEAVVAGRQQPLEKIVPNAFRCI